MAMQEVCSEAGRYAVYTRVLEEKASEVGFPYLEEDGFIEVFSLCFALLAAYPSNASIFERVPQLAFSCYDRRSVKDETDVLYQFPIEDRSKESDLLDMALLYLALDFGMANSEPDLAHLPFLFSIKEDIRPYIHAGYNLLPVAKEVEMEARSVIEERLPENLYDSLVSVRDQFRKIREYLAKHEGE